MKLIAIPSEELRPFFEPFPAQDFFSLKNNYVSRANLLRNLPCLSGIDFINDPIKVYFNLTSLKNILDENPDYLVFKFGCIKQNNIYKGFSLIMLGTDASGNTTSRNIYKSFLPGISPHPNSPSDLISFADDRILRIINCLASLNPPIQIDKDYIGYAFNIEKVKLWYKDVSAKSDQIVIYFGATQNKRTVLIVASSKKFADNVPTPDAPESHVVYDNGMQCCPVDIERK